MDSSPSISAAGAVYVGSDDGALYALNGSTGALLWSASASPPAAIKSSPLLDAAGKLFVGSTDGKLAAYDAVTGVSLWGFQTGAAIRSSPALGAGPLGPLVFIANDNETLFAVAADTGAHAWNVSLGPYAGGHRNASSSPVCTGGLVYIGSGGGAIWALQAATGAVQWHVDTGAPISGTPAVAAGVVYVGNGNGTILALNAATGAVVYAAAAGAALYSSPAVAGGYAYFPAADGILYTLETATGALANLGGPNGPPSGAPGGWPFVSSPAVDVGGIIYIGSSNGNIYGGNLTCFRLGANDTGPFGAPYSPGGGSGGGGSGGDCSNTTMGGGFFGGNATGTGNMTGSGNFTAGGGCATGNFSGNYSGGGSFGGGSFGGGGGGGGNGNGTSFDPCVLWNYTTGGVVASSPSLGYGPSLFVGSKDGYVRARAGRAARGRCGVVVWLPPFLTRTATAPPLRLLLPCHIHPLRPPLPHRLAAMPLADLRLYPGCHRRRPRAAAACGHGLFIAITDAVALEQSGGQFLVAAADAINVAVAINVAISVIGSGDLVVFAHRIAVAVSELQGVAISIANTFSLSVFFALFGSEPLGVAVNCRDNVPSEISERIAVALQHAYSQRISIADDYRLGHRIGVCLCFGNAVDECDGINDAIADAISLASGSNHRRGHFHVS